jgi:hypothetical protein
MLGNPVVFAIIVYGLTIAIALMVSGIIWLIGWAVKSRGARVNKE